jgi:hypothetical protein
MTCRRIIAPVTFAHDSLEGAAVAADLAAALGAEQRPGGCGADGRQMTSEAVVPGNDGSWITSSSAWLPS